MFGAWRSSPPPCPQPSTARCPALDSHRVLHFAKTRGKQNELLDLAYAANFAEERSVLDDERMLELAVQAGLDKTEVRADEQEAQMLGANGVPFFVLDRKFGGSGRGGVRAGRLRDLVTGSGSRKSNPAYEP